MYWRMLRYKDHPAVLDIIRQHKTTMENTPVSQWYLDFYGTHTPYDGPRFNREVIGAFYDDGTLFGFCQFRYFPGVLSIRADDPTKKEPFYSAGTTFIVPGKDRPRNAAGWSPEYTYLINAIIEESIQRGIYTCWHMFPTTFTALKDNPDYKDMENRVIRTVETVEAGEMPKDEFIRLYVGSFPLKDTVNVNVRTIKDEYRS